MGNGNTNGSRSRCVVVVDVVVIVAVVVFTVVVVATVVSVVVYLQSEHTRCNVM